MARPKLAKDKNMIEEGVMLINKGIKLGFHACEELNDDNNTQDGIGIGCYMLDQAIELLIKGLVHCFGETTPENHVIKPIARQLIAIYEHRVPELSSILASLEDLSNNHFTYVLHTWQSNGRYYFLDAEKSYVEKAQNVYNDLVRFSRNYQLTEVRESYDFF
jgi:HEPN domain-containing protein